MLASSYFETVNLIVEWILILCFLWSFFILFHFGESLSVLLYTKNTVHDLFGSFFWSKLVPFLTIIFNKNVILLNWLMALRTLAMAFSLLWILLFNCWRWREGLLLLEHKLNVLSGLMEAGNFLLVFFMLVLLFNFYGLFFCLMFLLLRFLLFYNYRDGDGSFSVFWWRHWSSHHSHHRVTKFYFPLQILLQLHDTLPRGFSWDIIACFSFSYFFCFGWIQRLSLIRWGFRLIKNSFIGYFKFAWLCLWWGRLIERRSLFTSPRFPHALQILKIRHIKL